MLYFKHFSNASTSLKLQEIKHEFGMEGYGRYWALFELMNEKFDGESVEVELHFKEILTRLEFRLKSSLKVFSDFLTSVQIISIIFETDSTLKLSCPMLLELMDRDSKYNNRKRVPDAEIRTKKKSNSNSKKNSKKESKIYGIHSKLSDDFLIPYFEKVKLETQEAWLKLYPDANWIKSELIKGANWLITSDAIRKDKGRFFSNWLSNAVEFSKKQTYKKDLYQKLLENNPYPEEFSA
jgi:hypothetical protein